MGLFDNNRIANLINTQQTRLNEGQIWLKIVDNSITKDFIIDLNTKEQLFEKGIDSEGTPLKDIGGNPLTESGYSPVTIEIKKSKGGRIKNITLFDTGKYYDSHDVIVTTSGFTIISDPQKDDTNLYEEWGEEIVGLTVESKQKLINFLLIRYQNYTRAVIFKT